MFWLNIFVKDIYSRGIYGLLFMTDCIKQLTRNGFGNYNNSGG